MLNTDTFSNATLLYARLRRVSGRVIDVIYLTENEEYALYILNQAQATGDDELNALCKQLYAQLQFGFEPIKEDVTEETPVECDGTEPTEEDVFRAQVSHHYIGALR